uniref:hypothetical protein n=1 Tax=Vibrio anguillarum TaxID=55601 RepID=UPI00188DAFDF
MNRLDTGNPSGTNNLADTNGRQEVMNHLENESLSVLKQLEVNTNIQLFARQWVDENGIESIDDMCALFDR